MKPKFQPPAKYTPEQEAALDKELAGFTPEQLADSTKLLQDKERVTK